MQNLNKIQNIKDRVFGKTEFHDLIGTYHYLMVHYGYIPFEDFKKMDANLVNELVKRINKMNEKQNKQMRGKR